MIERCAVCHKWVLPWEKRTVMAYNTTKQVRAGTPDLECVHEKCLKEKVLRNKWKIRDVKGAKA